MSNTRKGFTMVEAIFSVILLGTGIVATLGGLSALSKAEVDGQDREKMEQLAMEKYDEIVATGDTTSSDSGDFSDQNLSDYTWQSQVIASGVDNVNHIQVTVQKSNDPKGPVATFDSLLYVPPTTTTGTTGTVNQL